jgi:hypothetical protein
MEYYCQRFWQRGFTRKDKLNVRQLEVIMKTKQVVPVIFMVSIFILQGFSAPLTGRENSLTSDAVANPTPTPEPTKTGVAALIDGFNGRWLEYNTVDLDTGKPVSKYTGMEIEITETQLTANKQVCTDPDYKVAPIGVNEFLKGRKKPDFSFEINLKSFPNLSTGCKNLDFESIAQTNPRTLAVIIGSEILFFEPDRSVSSHGLTIKSEMFTETSETPLYEIHAQIPVLENAQSERFNDQARSIIMHTVDGFRDNFADWKIPTEMAMARSYLLIDYDVPLLTKDLVSLRYHVYYYNSGAVHPDYFFLVLNYDLSTDKEILFDDLFTDQKETAIYFSMTCKEVLEKPEYPIFEEGFGPKKENFNLWNLTPDRLRISFNPSVVAPYSSGPQEVFIPYRLITRLVDPKTTAGAFIAQ